MWKEDETHLNDLDFYTFQFETGLPGRLRDTIFIFNTIYFPEVASPELSGLPILSNIESPDDLGSLLKFTFFLESKRFLESRFDLFAGFSFQKSNASGDTAVLGIGGIPLKRLGLLNENGTSDQTAHAFHVGFRYTFPWEMLNQPKFGFEYNRNSKYWFGLNSGAEDPLMKLNARGASVYDFYYIQPINENFMFRFGYTILRSKYTGLWMWGDAPEVKERINNMYILMDARF